MASLPGAVRAAPPARAEAEVKAEFIERFTRFIEWPADAQPAPHAPFVVCTLGESPLSTHLERVLMGRLIQGHPAKVKRLREGEPVAGCHILYLAPGLRAQVEQLVEDLRGRPILLVADAPGFAELGLIINLFVDEDLHVRFEINPEMALASGLKISAKLMTLARHTRTRPRP